MERDAGAGQETAPDLVGRLAEEFLARYRRGERPALSEYTERHPELAERIHHLFPMLVLMEQAGSEAGESLSEGGAARRLGGQGAPSLQRMGDYRIIREIGRGGMGVVYEAEQMSLGRRVALKALVVRAPKDGNALARFRREARSAARLHHTNIVPVFEVGQDGDTFYYAMQLILGQGLDQVIDELCRLRADSAAGRSHPRSEGSRGGADGKASAAPPAAELAHSLRSGQFQLPTDDAVPEPARPDGSSVPASVSLSAVLPGRQELSSVKSDYTHYFRGVARIGQQAAEALGYAHQRGVVHRDVKPSNLLLDGSGVVWITDFGLAKTEDDALTSPGDVVGTIRYMAPERFRGECDVRADVYGLGLTLYELLTLRPAFDVADRLRLIEAVKTREPTRPQALDPRVPRDLETIVLKAIDKDPARRYASAQDLADDLRRFAADEPIRARRVSSAERLLRWARHNKVMAGLVAALALVFLAGFAGVAWKWREAEQAQGETQLALRQVDAALYASNIVRAQLQYHANNLEEAEQVLKHCPPERRGWEWHFLQGLNHSDLFTLEGHTGWVQQLAYSPDGRFLATAGGGNIYARGPDTRRPGEIIIWDAATGRKIDTLRGHGDVVTRVAFSPDSRLIASSSSDRTLRVWDVASRLPLRPPIELKAGLSNLVFTPDGRQVAGTDFAGMARFWDVASGAEQHVLPRQPGQFFAVTFSPDARRLVTLSPGREMEKLSLRDPTTGSVSRTIEDYRGPYRGIQLSPDGHWLLALTDQGVRLWDLTTGRNLPLALPRHSSAAFSPDGRSVALGGFDAVVRLCRLPGGEEFRQYRGHLRVVQCVAFSPDGQRLASGGGDDGVAKVWDLTRDPVSGAIHPALTFGENSEGLTFSADSGRLFLATDGRLVTVNLEDSSVLDCQRLRPEVEFAWPAGEPVSFDPEGRCLVAVVKGDRSRAHCWDVRTGRERLVLRGHTLDIYRVQVSRAGRRIATASGPGITRGRSAEIKVWDGDTGQPVMERAEPDTGIVGLALSPEGDRLAVAERRPPAADGSFTCFVRVFQVPSQRVLHEFEVKNECLEGLAFSPDGGRLAGGGSEATVIVANLATGERITSHQGPKIARQVAFSPDGTRLVVVGQYESKVLHAATGEEFLVLRTEAQHEYNTGGANPRACFSPDGKHLAALWGRSLSVWSAEADSPQAQTDRCRSADRRAIVYHLREAAESGADRAALLFHLRHVAGLPLASPWDYLARGRLYQRLGQQADARADFAKAAELSPNNPELLDQLGRADVK